MSNQPRKDNGQFAHKSAPVPKPSPKLPTAFDKMKTTDKVWTVSPKVCKLPKGEIIATLSIQKFSTRNNAEAYMLNLIHEYCKDSDTYIIAWFSHPVYGSHLADPQGKHHMAFSNIYFHSPE